MTRIFVRVSTVIAAVLASPALALACPVCFAAKNEASRIAFLATTVFMTALPLIMIGGVVYWLMNKVQEAEHGEAIEPPAPARVPARTDELPVSGELVILSSPQP